MVATRTAVMRSHRSCKPDVAHSENVRGRAALVSHPPSPPGMGASLSPHSAAHPAALAHRSSAPLARTHAHAYSLPTRSRSPLPHHSAHASSSAATHPPYLTHYHSATHHHPTASPLEPVPPHHPRHSLAGAPRDSPRPTRAHALHSSWRVRERGRCFPRFSPVFPGASGSSLFPGACRSYLVAHRCFARTQLYYSVISLRTLAARPHP